MEKLRGEIVIYETADAGMSVEVRLEEETVWLTQQQMSDLFERDRTVITRHLRNIFSTGELAQESNVHRKRSNLRGSTGSDPVKDRQ